MYGFTDSDELRRRNRKKQQRKKAILSAIGSIAAGLVFGGFVFAMILCWLLEEPDSFELPEHYGQIEYCGTWFDYDDYEAMMQEREEYLRKEREAEMKFYEQIERLNSENLTAGVARVLYDFPETQPYESMIKSTDWDAEEGYLLAKIAMAEAESECIECKALVICTVLNRVWSKDFPDNIHDVIFEEHNGVYQFSPVGDGRFDRVEPNSECFDALYMVQVEHWDESQGAMWFELTKNEPTWHSRNLERLFSHCETTFYKLGED